MTFLRVLAILMSLQTLLLGQVKDPSIRNHPAHKASPAQPKVDLMEPKLDVHRASRHDISSSGTGVNTMASSSRDLEKLETKGIKSLHTTSSSHASSTKNRPKSAVAVLPGNRSLAENNRNKRINFSYHPSNVSNKQLTRPTQSGNVKPNVPR